MTTARLAPFGSIRCEFMPRGASSAEQSIKFPRAQLQGIGAACPFAASHSQTIVGADFVCPDAPSSTRTRMSATCSILSLVIKQSKRRVLGRISFRGVKYRRRPTYFQVNQCTADTVKAGSHQKGVCHSVCNSGVKMETYSQICNRHQSQAQTCCTDRCRVAFVMSDRH